jgi:hypothetical protein
MRRREGDLSGIEKSHLMLVEEACVSCQQQRCHVLEQLNKNRVSSDENGVKLQFPIPSLLS